MSTVVRHVHSLTGEVINGLAVEEPVVYLIITGEPDVTNFKKLVQQGSNLVPDLSPAMKELADLVTVGKIQQNYQGGNK